MGEALALREHQKQIARFILNTPRCAVWARMGAGKTAATLSALAVLEERPILILAPRRVAADVWPAECDKWRDLFDLSCVPILGTPAQRKAALATEADIYTISYDLLPWLIETTPWRWPVVVADEATRLKSFRTRKGGKRAAALAKIVKSGATTRFIELTGTPAPNGLIDLWGQMWFLDGGQRLGTTFTSFAARWFITAGFGGYQFGYRPRPSAQREINSRLADICLTAEVPFTVDAPVVTDVPVTLPADAREQYERLERDMYTTLAAASSVTAVNAAALTNKCRQIASGAAYVDEGESWAPIHEAKLDALESIVVEAAGANIIVAYDYRFEAERIKQRFSYAVDISEKNAIQRWNAGEIRMLLMHPASAGHGLNLQYGGNIIAFYTLPWSLELYQQAIERVGPLRQRQAGFDRPCLVYRIVARDTVDEQVVTVLETKATVQEVLLEALRRRRESSQAPR